MATKTSKPLAKPALKAPPAKANTPGKAGKAAKSRVSSKAKSISPMTSAPVIEPGVSLTQRAYAEIKRRVITLAFKPGEFLTEPVICQLLDIGRTPVHEALHLLKLEGLVEIIPRKGILIRPDSLNDVISLLETRMIVEPQCAALAAERAKAIHIEALDAVIAETRRAIEQGDRMVFMSLDNRFHDTLIDAAANPVLGDVMRLLHQRASRIWHLQVWSDDDLKLTRQEHESISKAVKRGDREAAASAAQNHLASLKRRILNRTS